MPHSLRRAAALGVMSRAPTASLQLVLLFTAMLTCKSALTDIVLFGDSLSDDCSHGASTVVDGALGTDQSYPGAPYYKGCVFSNGPVYIDIAAGLLHVSLEDFAVGGATSGAVMGELGIPVGFANRTTATTIEVPSTLDQAEMFVDMNKGTVSSSTLFAIYIGGNDYIDTLGKGNGTVQEVLMYTEAAMDMLYEAGARV